MNIKASIEVRDCLQDREETATRLQILRKGSVYKVRFLFFLLDDPLILALSFESPCPLLTIKNAEEHHIMYINMYKYLVISVGNKAD